MYQKTAKKNTGSITRRPSLKPRSETEITSPIVRRATINLSRRDSKTKSSAPKEPDRSEDSLEVDDVFDYTLKLKDQILTSMNDFKSATSGFIEKNTALEQEVDSFQNNFETVKSDIAEIYLQSSKSRSEVALFKKKLSETFEKVEEFQPRLYLDSSMSVEKNLKNELINKDLQNKVEILKAELEDLRKYVVLNEECFKTVEAENTELRNITYQIKENLSFEKFTSEKRLSSCKSCIVS